MILGNLLLIISLQTYAAISYEHGYANTVNYIESNGYKAEAFYVKTPDNYILAIHHLLPKIKDKENVKRPPFLLMHGLAASSADWVSLNPKRGLGYVLSDNGYDVWLGNCRGTPWSRNHTTLDSYDDSQKFWNFSIEEIAYHDLPTTIDFILNKTNTSKLFYAGVSQGAMTFYMMLSLRPEYNEKIRLGVALAAVTYTKNSKNNMLSLAASYVQDIEALLNKAQIYEIPGNAMIRTAGQLLCRYPFFYTYCSEYLFLMAGFEDFEQLETNLLPHIFTNYPLSASMRQVYHILQMRNAGKWQQYDYGSEKNMKIYGSTQPPLFDLSKITAPIAIYYGNNDVFSSGKDAELFAKDLPNAVHVYGVPHKKFNHMDFIYAKDIYKLLYRDMLKIIQKY